MNNLNEISFFLDARKLGDGGIGRFIELLILGFKNLKLGNKTNIKLFIITSSKYIIDNQSLIQDWKSASFEIVPDDSPKYSLKELFILPLKYRSEIASNDYYISPHYVLPFFIPIKKLLCIHDVIHLQYPEKKLNKIISYFLISSAINRADTLLSVSNTSVVNIKKFFTIPKSKNIFIVPNASFMETAFKDCSKESQTQMLREKKILWIGADRSHKRLDFFLDFLKTLLDKKFQFHAIIVSKLKNENIEKISSLGLINNITILSNISDEELSKIYNSADCFITTSIEEGFCIPLLDAMRTRVPVLCPKLSFTNELIGEDAWYYSPTSIDNAVNAYNELFNETEDNLAKKYERCENAYNKSLNYTPSNMALSLLKSIGFEYECA